MLRSVRLSCRTLFLHSFNINTFLKTRISGCILIDYTIFTQTPTPASVFVQRSVIALTELQIVRDELNGTMN